MQTVISHSKLIYCGYHSYTYINYIQVTLLQNIIAWSTLYTAICQILFHQSFPPYGSCKSARFYIRFVTMTVLWYCDIVSPLCIKAFPQNGWSCQSWEFIKCFNVLGLQQFKYFAYFHHLYNGTCIYMSVLKFSADTHYRYWYSKNTQGRRLEHSMQQF